MTEKKRRLVLIDWIDSHSGSGWRWLDEIEDECQEFYCESVGWLVRRTKHSTTIVPHMSGHKNENNRVSGKGELCIPNVAIRKIKTLRG